MSTGEFFLTEETRNSIKAAELKVKQKLTGGFVNYYLIHIPQPQRKEQVPYTAECEDIGAELRLTPDEMNIFKAIWRSAAARLGNGKPDHKSVYDAEKMVHYANRNLKWVKRHAD